MKPLLFVVLVANFTACASGPAGEPGPAGEAGPAGAPGPAGPSGPASIGAVVPARAFLARTIDVQITGYATAWSSASTPTVDFGPGVTVKHVAVASETSLLVTIQVDPTAPVGPRDVTVAADGKTDTWAGGFQIASPLAVTFEGTLAPGSMLLGRARDLDLDTPFDVTAVLPYPLRYPNLEFAPLPGFALRAAIEPPTIYGFTFTLCADVNAPFSTPQSLDLRSGPKGGAVDDFPLPNAFSLTPRDPHPLADGLAFGAKTSTPYESALYAWYPTDKTPTIVEIWATSSVAGANPATILLPASGKCADAWGVGGYHTFATTSLDPLYVVYWDSSGTTGDYHVTATTTPATGAALDPAASTKATAQAVGSAPVVLTGGVLATSSSRTWVKITAGASDVGKSFHVVTYPGDPMTDTRVEVQTSTGVSLGGPSPDVGDHEDFSTPPIPAAGDYYLIVSAGAAYDSHHQAFEAWVRVD